MNLGNEFTLFPSISSLSDSQPIPFVVRLELKKRQCTSPKLVEQNALLCASIGALSKKVHSPDRRDELMFGVTDAAVQLAVRPVSIGNVLVILRKGVHPWHD